MHLLGPSGNMLGSIIYVFSFPPVLIFRPIFAFMNLTFIPVVVPLSGLFGLAFAIFGAITHKRGGLSGKTQPNRPSQGYILLQKDFHHCATPGCKLSIPGQDPHTTVSPVSH